jgi:hypothetical protein
MATLSSDLRNKLERTVVEARCVAEAGAQAALEAFAVGHHEPFGHMTPEQRKRRTHLRARAKQLGDQRDKNGRMELTHIAHECAYEHWHRMLFARFLAENGLLIEPDSGVAISLDECKELAKAEVSSQKSEVRSADMWEFAGRCAQTMLPQIFRPDDPLLQVPLAREHQLKLEELLDGVSHDVFTASDSLGWCYQFWQAEKKDQVNASGEKVSADELPAVTQLFTEDYMVDFLLDNTLGAWWWGRQVSGVGCQASAGKVRAAKTEDDCRRLVALPGCPWKYLRFVKDEKAGWRPAAGTFDGWPKTTKELKCLDPCMGSGHFVVAMFERLVALRMAEELLGEKHAVAAVIRENLFGLEIDPRCTQIGAFNLALAAWRRVGHRPLPDMNLACSGLAPNSTKEDWLKLAGDNEKLHRGMERFFLLFHNAPVLGSLINPRASEGDLLVAAYHELQPLMATALAQERTDDNVHEMAVIARGLARAAQILAGQFPLVATNVPYLLRRNQSAELRGFCERSAPDAANDLAIVFLQRILAFLSQSGCMAVVVPSAFLFLKSYVSVRDSHLREQNVRLVSLLGPRAFRTISGEVVNVSLYLMCRGLARDADDIVWVDATAAEEKDSALINALVVAGKRRGPLSLPDRRLTPPQDGNAASLTDCANAYQGFVTGDDPRMKRFCWEVQIRGQWVPFQSTTDRTIAFGGCEGLVDWSNDGNRLARRQGVGAWLQRGVSVSAMSDLPCALYSGAVFDVNTCAVVPADKANLPALWAFCVSGEFSAAVRRIDTAIKVTTASFVKVAFDLAHWQKVAAEKYPHGLPKPFSSDPTQWLFDGHPKGSDNPLHVAAARMLGYQWPRQAGSSFPDCPALDPDGLEKLADHDGIVCIPSVRGEEPAAERLRRLLAKAYGNEWTAPKERELMAATGSSAADLDEWLRNDFFQQHCDLFHQRPFVWHIWDGRKRDGFQVLVNYHKLADGAPASAQATAGQGKGRKLLEKLTHAYLNDWITRQRDGVKHGEGGAEDRLAAAEELKTRLEAIIEGEPPFDIFVRWKPLHQQAIGWEPDINDGVRLNIRPFLTADIPGGKKGAGILRWKPSIKWDKDRGKEPERPKSEYPWFWKWDEKTQDFMGGREYDGNRWNDCHYTNRVKMEARKAAEKK